MAATPKSTQRERVTIELKTLDELAAWDANPKDHDVGLLITSLRTYGLIRPPCINEATKKLLFGHGLSKALRVMHDDGEAPPRRVELRDGEWVVPTLVVDLEEPLHEPYLVVDNRSTELGGWDEPTLLEVLMRTHENELLFASGFDESDLDRMYEQLTPDAAENDPNVPFDDSWQESSTAFVEFAFGDFKAKCRRETYELFRERVESSASAMIDDVLGELLSG